MLKLTRFTGLTSAAVAALVVGFPAALQAAGDHGKSYGHAGASDEIDRTVQVEASGMRFSHQQILTEPGQTVRFVVSNTGETQHEFTIGPPKVQQAHRAEMREMMGDTHGNQDHHGGDGHHGDDGHHDDQAGSMGHGTASSGHGHANSVMVQPGETKELIWHFAEVEDVRFGCNVPGHYQAGMHGPFVTDE